MSTATLDSWAAPFFLFRPLGRFGSVRFVRAHRFSCVESPRNDTNVCSFLSSRRAVFAWIFTSWALLAVTPVYVFMVRGLENAGFVQEELDEISRLQAALPSSSSSGTQASSAAAPPRPHPPPQSAEVKQHTV